MLNYERHIIMQCGIIMGVWSAMREATKYYAERKLLWTCEVRYTRCGLLLKCEVRYTECVLLQKSCGDTRSADYYKRGKCDKRRWAIYTAMYNTADRTVKIIKGRSMKRGEQLLSGPRCISVHTSVHPWWEWWRFEWRIGSVLRQEVSQWISRGISRGNFQEHQLMRQGRMFLRSPDALVHHGRSASILTRYEWLHPWNTVVSAV